MERRLVERVSPVKAVSARLRTSLLARVIDVSARGVYLETTQALAPNSVCDLHFTGDDGHEVTLSATVKRCRVWGAESREKGKRVLLYRAGLEFKHPSATLLEILAEKTPLVLSPRRAQVDQRGAKAEDEAAPADQGRSDPKA